MDAMMRPEDFDTILSDERIVMHFQPIVSTGRRAILMVEALARGTLPQSDTLVSPQTLFEEAAARGRVLDLDRLCRKKALAAFLNAGHEAKNLLLAVNFSSSVLDEKVVGSNHFLNAVSEAGLAPNRIVIEIIESNVPDVAALRRFTERYREAGFLIALDDFGAGHSNFDRIPLIKPDILKIDRCLISGMGREYHKREIVKALIGMAHQIGAIAIAEGIENTDDLLAAQKAGIDMFQGFLFARPASREGGGFRCPCEVLAQAAAALHESTGRDLALRREICGEYCVLQDECASALEKVDVVGFDPILEAFVEDELALEAVYVTDADGVLVTDTHVQAQVRSHTRSCLVAPAPRGTDLSLKPYCAGIRAGMERFMSEPYLSQATGDVCITLSRPITDRAGTRHILCCDIAFSAPEPD